MSHTQEVARILDWIRRDADRMSALKVARDLALPDWCLAAGFVRNLVWDKLHGYQQPTPLNDLDLVYFDRDAIDSAFEKKLERNLAQQLPRPWSVKNQARMHQKTGNRPYTSTSDAIRHWVEVETAVGVYLDNQEKLHLIAPLGIESLMAGRLSLNLTFPQPDVFKKRIRDKAWLSLWPRLSLQD